MQRIVKTTRRLPEVTSLPSDDPAVFYGGVRSTLLKESGWGPFRRFTYRIDYPKCVEAYIGTFVSNPEREIERKPVYQN